MILRFVRKIGDRLLLAVCTRTNRTDWLYALLLLGLYSLIYLPMGFVSGFLKFEPRWDALLKVTIGAFISPGLTEESVFRVLLIPHRSEPVLPYMRWVWTILSWLAFVIYHPLNPGGRPFFSSPIFLLGAGLLGMICTSSYLRSGSLWIPVILHWLIVVVWLVMLGGLEKFTSG
ncbi:type II CAAX prenyl endopeptidase Rce1 family protein [Phormidesmis sp. 146-12]